MLNHVHLWNASAPGECVCILPRDMSHKLQNILRDRLCLLPLGVTPVGFAVLPYSPWSTIAGGHLACSCPPGAGATMSVLVPVLTWTPASSWLASLLGLL